MTYDWTVTFRVGDRNNLTVNVSAPTGPEALERASAKALDFLDDTEPLIEHPCGEIEAVAIECTGMVEP
jgi:hypothetical protein